MDSLVQDLLSYSRVSQEELPLERVDLGRLSALVVDHQRVYLTGRGAQVAIDPDLPEVLAHPVALSRALSNLVENAAKFVPPDRPPRVRISAERLGPRVRVVVEDNGIGIAPEYREKIFALFSRLNRSEDYTGTGVGLAIVRKTVEKMGGTVGVDGLQVQGSRFWIELSAVS
jgi:signal transduction histidine kinase